ncbi:Ureidoglycolate lyase [Nowakowskiella sp. JEL0407]|nr:Ureidoglycolate lyase [Nowakowskiella sp. JEL0407]
MSACFALLERHKYSTQMFIPMFTTSSPAKYLIIVALNDPSTDKPDLSTLKAFVGDSTQGINYKCGCWHHPIVVFTHDSETKYVDFTCVVYERGEDQIVDSEDTEEVWYVGDDAERKMDIKVFGLRLKSKL